MPWQFNFLTRNVFITSATFIYNFHFKTVKLNTIQDVLSLLFYCYSEQTGSYFHSLSRLSHSLYQTQIWDARINNVGVTKVPWVFYSGRVGQQSLWAYIIHTFIFYVIFRGCSAYSICEYHPLASRQFPAIRTISEHDKLIKHILDRFVSEETIRFLYYLFTVIV